ncbi:hypothetical protein [Qipengyuania qiaonensis]|uniref:Lipoprotein n=1 Tax=Qipengyuania qiaonensis TaxID=2867240 RepID=A0ABS7J9Z2_9SPHN|nr:hypothetical protein [Qipengyuania qiaonensis]MBX7482790.1 hypothetical protein [Qipengyuania qiaonensis]
MRYLAITAMPLALGLAACGSEPAPDAAGETTGLPIGSASASTSGSATAAPPADAAPTPDMAGAWDMTSSGEGDGLFFAAAQGEPARVHVFCPSGGGVLVNVNAFRPIASEERMTFGSGADAVTLVADPAGDDLRGGVSGEGEVPTDLGVVLTGGVAVRYGTQDIGPLPPVPAAMARDFVAGCTD